VRAGRRTLYSAAPARTRRAAQETDVSRRYPPPVLAERYLQALGSDDPIEALRAAPARLRDLAGGLSRSELRAAPAPGKWSVHQVLAHLADGEIVLGARMRFVAAMDRPVLVGYDQDAFVAALGYDEVESEELVEAFAQVRALNVALLERLPDAAFARVGLHSERGEESLSTLVHLYAGHDRVHQQQIVATRDRVAAELRSRGRR
jgi:hypothetical protein